MSEKTHVYGKVVLRVEFDVIIDMPLEQFEELSEWKQNELIDSHINWTDAMQSSEIDEIDVYEYREASNIED